MPTADHQRMSELDERIRVLNREKRQLEEMVEELKPRRTHVATLGEWIWREA